MSRAEDDAIATQLRAAHDAALAADARQLSGAEVRQIRTAVERATTALGRLNPKGLPFAHRREVEAARSALADAARLVAQHHSEHAAPSSRGSAPTEERRSHGRRGVTAG